MASKRRPHTLEIVEIDPMFESLTLMTRHKGTRRGDASLTAGNDYVAAYYVQAPMGKVQSIAAYLDRCLSHIPPSANGRCPFQCLFISRVNSHTEESDGTLVARGQLGAFSKDLATHLPATIISEFSQACEPKSIIASQTLDLEELGIREDNDTTPVHMTLFTESDTYSSGVRRTIPPASQEVQPGAFAVEGPGFESMIRRPQNQASVVRADAVDDAELVVYASSVAPDERVKLRRRMFLMCIVALFLIVGLAVGVVTSANRVGSAKPPGDAKPPEPCFAEDVFSYCECYNSTSGSMSEDEVSIYYEIQRILLDKNVVVEVYEIESCEPENQCIVWAATFEQRNTTRAEANMTLQSPELVIQDHVLCMTYQTLDGASWKRNDGWLEEKDRCNWFGLICTFLSRITNIELASNGLNGYIPPELGFMPFLEGLNLSQNRAIRGAIPSELMHASTLRLLDLSTTGVSGSIPSEIGRLEILDHLVLTYSSFSGSLPDSLSNLTRMREVYLEQNNFSGTLHTDFGILTNLEIFKADDNSFSGSIPQELSSWQYLQHIGLSRNGFTGVIPSFLGNLRYLVTMSIFDTQLSGTVPESFCEPSPSNKVIILKCSSNIVPNCTCCNDLVFCAEEELPPGMQQLI